MGLPVARGGPGTHSPGRIRWTNVTLMYVIMRAYGLQSDQVRGPERLITDRYTVDAIVPSGATVEQFQQMLQKLLSNRFRLAFQWEEREFKVYRLVIAAGGPKLRSSAVSDPEDGHNDSGSERVLMPQYIDDKNGCPQLPPTRRGAVGQTGGSNCSTFVGYSMSELADRLGQYIAAEAATVDVAHLSPAHVVDATGLNGARRSASNPAVRAGNVARFEARRVFAHPPLAVRAKV